MRSKLVPASHVFLVMALIGLLSLPASPAAARSWQGSASAAASAAQAATLDLSLDRFYINQAVPALQSNWGPNGRTALVAGRRGIARAFVSANEENAVRPTVELHWRRPNGATGVVRLWGRRGVPLQPREGQIETTFNSKVRPFLLKPGLEVFVVVDPDNDIDEADETNNRWPATGWVDAGVVAVPDVEVTWVPVIWNGVQGNIDAGNVNRYEDQTLRMMPIPGISSQIHSPIVFNGDLSTQQDWVQLLQQVAAVRDAEGSDRAYHGIVHRPPGPGIAGIGYVGFEVAVSFDEFSTASNVVAHEFGHNFGLPHAPCGDPSNPDPNYPYPDAAIGRWGYDHVDESLKSPRAGWRDFMSYCDPTWISDYNYRKLVANRVQVSVGSPVFDGTALHVSGTIDAGGAVIEPSYAMSGGGLEPEAGAYTLVGLGATAERLFEVPFTAFIAEINQGSDDDTEHFNFGVSVSDEQARQLVRLQVERNGAVIGERTAAPAAQAAQAQRSPTVYTDNGNGTATIIWDSTVAIGVVRAADSGEVLAISTTGAASIPATTRQLEVVLSTGLATGWTDTVN